MTELAVEIIDQSHDGRGVAKHNGKTIFVTGALPGEAVNCRITKNKRNFSEAEVIDIISTNPDRVEPKCAVFGVCGGCQLQHLSSPAQIKAKQLHLQKLLESVAKVAPETWLAPLQAQSYGYRRKARLGVKYVKKKEKVLVGFRERGTSFIVDAERCEILDPAFADLASFKQLISDLSIYDAIPQLEVAASDSGAAIVVRHLREFTDEDKQKLIAFGEQHKLQIYLQPKGPDSVTLLSPGPARLNYQLADGLNYDSQPLDFVQVNKSINDLMLAQALEHLDLAAEHKVLDLFCGLGNFSLPLATKVKQVVAVEGDQAMVNAAEQNAALNGLSNIAFYAENLFEQPWAVAWADQTYDRILLDPPRSGAEAIVNNIGRFKAEKIVYISCHPATLVRDIDILVNQKGYKLTHCGVMDMFPHTGHVESMAVLTKA